MLCTGNSAERGLLEPICNKIRANPELKLIKVDVSPLAVDFCGVFNKISYLIDSRRPDIVLIPCDRKEMLAAAISAFYKNVPIVHYGGGDIGFGTFDDITRHVISMFASYVLCKSEENKRRLVSMGKEPERVFVVKSTAFDDLVVDESLVPKEPFDLVLQHPVSSFPDVVKEEMIKIFDMLDKYTIVLYPNTDEGYEGIVEVIKSHESDKNVKIYERLPRAKFLGLLKNCKRFIGNSSAGYYEAPFFGTEFTQVGIRNSERSKPEKIETGGSEQIVGILSSIDLKHNLQRFGYGLG